MRVTYDIFKYVLGRGDVSYHRPDDAEGGLGQIGESVYVKDVDDHIVHEETTIHFEDA